MQEYFREVQRFWENLFKYQANLIETLNSTLKNLVKYNIMNNNIAVFRAKVQSGGRISIPETDRVVLNLQDGDIVKVIVIKEGGE
ncbi:MAG: AbrB/MazE/SpoVT family DNA-binding domain-containing protein [Archaeoglobaceae archaeon]|nr:AbrB/MazE/SpoVT family DNA-binding domain-containing protein [Archaeoglobaceae archaeon]MCX8152284.1 AbrB/MazE/SpoVT family DNA-binding domain-containing protein [Archaeoglobaceae archaeon]MDW8013962.1 AbrB/MazE/SpoVT family DNA-binding domain-containing protein [Archaeoglobaceae archaeon]